MRRAAVVAVLTPALALAGAGGYAWADAADLVPGWITTSPEPVPPAPFLTADAVEPASATQSAVAGLFDPGAPLPEAAALTSLAQTLRDDARLRGTTNVSVIDLVTGQVLVDLDATEPQVPASTTKVLTAVAVVSALGPDHTFSTVATFDPATGIVTLVAGGDMLLAADAGTRGVNPDTAAVWGGDMPAVGYAGLGDLADQVVGALEAAGVTEVGVAVDTAAFPGPAYPTVWPDYAIEQGYAAPVTGIAVNVGKVGTEEYSERYADPASAAADAFAARLTERGITASRVGARTASGAEVGRVESAPLSQVAAYMLHASDNTVAELLTRMLAISQGQAATPTAAMRAVLDQLGALGIDTTGVVLQDGAGYSTGNRIPPATLTSALRVATLTPQTSQLLGWLPEAGVSGTMAERLVGTRAAGVSFAKTGSLTGVTSLTGVVMTAEGRPLLFAVLADGMPYGQDGPRTATDEFVAALANYGAGT